MRTGRCQAVCKLPERGWGLPCQRIPSIHHGSLTPGVLRNRWAAYFTKHQQESPAPHPNPLPAQAGRGSKREAVTPSPRLRGEGWGEGVTTAQKNLASLDHRII